MKDKLDRLLELEQALILMRAYLVENHTFYDLYVEVIEKYEKQIKELKEELNG